MLLAVAGASLLTAHDIPNEVAVQAFVKPQGERLYLLVRVPLHSMRDFAFPQRGPGYLDVARAAPLLEDAAQQWIAGAVDIFENDRPVTGLRVMKTRIALESDRSFGSYDRALENLSSPPLDDQANVVINQALLDVLFEAPIQSDRARFAIHSKLSHLGQRVVTVLRFMPPDGGVRPFEFTGDPGLVALDPSWLQASWRFVVMGTEHILEGTDHLLFLVCLVLPVRRFLGLVPVVTAFTVAHSVTLLAAAYNWGPDALWFPPLIEVLIALSIVYLAIENLIRPSSTEERWLITFAFGLVHGFGFSFGLRENLQFAGTHLLASLLSFNLGVELGQLAVLIVLVGAFNLIVRATRAERMTATIVGVLVAHTGWHWMVERWDKFRQFPLHWPVWDAALLAALGRWLLVLLVLGGLLRWAQQALRRRQSGSAPAVSR